MKASDKHTRGHGKEKRDHCRRDRVGIKHFQKFDIRCDDRDQIAPVTPFEFRRTKLPQRKKYTVAQKRKQFKRNEMITGLFPVAQKSTRKRTHQKQGKNKTGRNFVNTCDAKQRIAAKNGKQRRAEMSEQSKENGKDHISGERSYQPDQFCHYGNITSLFHAVSSFFICSNACCVFQSDAYTPRFSNSFSCVPCSASFPSAST